MVAAAAVGGEKGECRPSELEWCLIDSVLSADDRSVCVCPFHMESTTQKPQKVRRGLGVANGGSACY